MRNIRKQAALVFNLRLSSLLIGALLLAPLTSSAQNEEKRAKVQSGEIDLKFEDERSEDPYEATKNSIISKLESFQAAIHAGNFSSAPEFTDEELLFLAAINLFCTLRDGACPLIPYTLLEVDLVRGSNQDKAVCSNLPRFWKQWVTADMEKRVGMSLKVVHYEKYEEFKRKVRPKLLRCGATVTDILSQAKDRSAFLKERYSAGSEQGELPAQLVAYITALHTKIRNIFRETGVRG